MEIDRAQLVRDFKNTFASEHGTRVLEYLEKFTLSSMRQSAFDPSSERQSCYNMGAQSVYRHIVYILSQDPDEKPKDALTEAPKEEL